MKNNTYFEELERIGSEWTKAHEAHKKLKEQIIEEKGWDSEELKVSPQEEKEEVKEEKVTGLQATALKNLSEADVIKKVGSLFTADQKKSGILASVSLAQFILESGCREGIRVWQTV